MELSRPLPLILGGLAVARLTRLITEDLIAEPLRARFGHQRSDAASYFVTCPWCVSMWLAGGWAILVSTAPRCAMTAGAVLAWSEISGLLAELT